MKWIWPVCWYYRIKQLERENVQLRATAVKWEGVARAAAVSQCAMAGVYASSLASMCGQLSTYGSTVDSPHE